MQLCREASVGLPDAKQGRASTRSATTKKRPLHCPSCVNLSQLTHTVPGRTVFEVPVGFKWFVGGLLDGSLGFGGEESAGATCSRLDGRVWTTDKDGFVPCLLAAEMTARMGRDPGEMYQTLTREFGDPRYDRVEAPATGAEKAILERLSPDPVKIAELAGEKIKAILTHAPGNGAPIEGLKVVTESGWFAARPSGTEDIYKIYAESFRDDAHLHKILEEAQTIIGAALAAEIGSKAGLAKPLQEKNASEAVIG